MRDEYTINELNPKKNPYASRLAKQIIINTNGRTNGHTLTPYSFNEDYFLTKNTHCHLSRRLHLAWRGRTKASQ